MRLPITVGTRGSPLAIAQTRHVRDRLMAAHPVLADDGALLTQVIATSGDRITDRPLAAIGGKGLFTKEIEEALLDRRIDLAVHSMKDVPTWLPEGLEIAAIPQREDPRDVLILRAMRRAWRALTICRRGHGWAPDRCAAGRSSWHGVPMSRSCPCAAMSGPGCASSRTARPTPPCWRSRASTVSGRIRRQ